MQGFLPNGHNGFVVGLDLYRAAINVLVEPIATEENSIGLYSLFMNN